MHFNIFSPNYVVGIGIKNDDRIDFVHLQIEK